MTIRENAISKLRRSRYLLAFPAWGRGTALAVDRVLRYCMTAEQALEEGPRQRRRIECLAEAQISRTENDEWETSAARIVILSGALDFHCTAENSTQAFFKKRRLTYCLTFVVSLSARRIS